MSYETALQLSRTGDANLDGSVSKPDYTSVRRNFGNTDAFWTSGDFNYDGVVDTVDFNELAANISPKSVREIPADQAAQSASTPSVGVPTPEPGGALLATAAACGVAGSRRRHRSRISVDHGIRGLLA